MMGNVGFYSQPMWVCVCVGMHACMSLCVFYTHVALKACGEKSLQGKNKSLSFWQLSFSFPTPYSSTHASCSPGIDWLFGLVSQLHACMFNSSFLFLSLSYCLSLIQSVKFSSSHVQVMQLIGRERKKNSLIWILQLFLTHSMSWKSLLFELISIETGKNNDTWIETATVIVEGGSLGQTDYAFAKSTTVLWSKMAWIMNNKKMWTCDQRSSCGERKQDWGVTGLPVKCLKVNEIEGQIMCVCMQLHTREDTVSISK